VLIETDGEIHWSRHFTHAGGGSPRHSPLEHQRNLYAALLAQACNFGSTRMAELTGISADTIDWTTQWYLREETLRAANTEVVNAHYRHPLAQLLGDGTLSSSDGLRLPMRGRSLTGRALSRYFVDEGLTSYTHVSDQHSTFGTQIIVSTERDATFTLDEILGNTTELPLLEHTTDSHGQTLATFAMFDLVDKRLSPRIAKLTEKQLYRPRPASHYKAWPLAGPLLKHHAQIDLIDAQWDDLLRIGASLKQGYVSAALLIAKLQAGSRQHPLSKAMLEYGKLLHAPRAALVHRRGVPPPDRPAARPRRGAQRPAPLHLLRQPRNCPLLRPRRPDDPGALPHPRRQHLHPLHDRLPPRRRARRTRRRAPRQRRSDRQPQPWPVRDDQPLRHPYVRHPRCPRAAPPTTSRL
jgi:TnpA family transposase